MQKAFANAFVPAFLDAFRSGGFGPELITDPYFSVSGLPSWVMRTNGTDTQNTAWPAANYLLVTSGDGAFDRIEPTTTLSGLDIGATYRVTAVVQSMSGNVSNQGFRSFTFTNGLENVSPVGTTRQTITVDVVATATSGRPRIYVNQSGGAIGDAMRVFSFSMKKDLGSGSYGPELITNPDMGSTSGWSVASSGTLTAGTGTQDPEGFEYYARCVSGDGSNDRLELNTSLTGLVVGARYRVRAYARSVSGTFAEQGLRLFSFSAGTESALFTAADEWQWLEVTAVATSTSGTPRLYVNQTSGAVTDTVDVAYLSMKRVF